MIRVVGTAGHVDHGKSTLVQALTGMNPDRLREEQERQMTIDLGFAWMDLPDGTSVGWVDVPGHRDFIENMLAGVTGVDAAVLVVAADEGVMPQTREHLAILDLLQVERLLVVLTKIDLVEEEGWVALVDAEVRKLLSGTRYGEAPLVAVSSVRGDGLDELVQSLANLLRDAPARPDLGRPRLAVDRAFTMQGFGTVVTGTLADGKLDGGEAVVLLPSGQAARVRGLQTHRKKVETAYPGSRVAANLTGIEVTDIDRGDVVCHPGTYAPTALLDVQIRVLADAAADLRHQQSVKLHIGAAERMATFRLLDRERVARGESGTAQLVLERPVVAARGDRFILRRPTPGATLAGGVVLDPAPARRHRRRDQAAAARLQTLEQGSTIEVLAEEASRRVLSSSSELARAVGVPEEEGRRAVEELVARHRLVSVGEGASALWMDVDRFESMSSQWQNAVGVYHSIHPLRHGLPREELRSRQGIEAVAFAAILSEMVRRGLLLEVGARLSLPGHQPLPSPQDHERLGRVLDAFAAAPASPPSVSDCREELGAELFAFAVESGFLTQVSDEVVFRTQDYREYVDQISQRVGQGPTTVAQVRDLLGSSRKYVLALLEHLDRTGVTVREGDIRRLAKPARNEAAD